MNDQAKKLRELAQKIREERDRINLIIDPMVKKPEAETIGLNVPDIKELGGFALEANPVAEAPKLAAQEEVLVSKIDPASTLAGTNGASFPKVSTRVIAVSSGKGGVGKSNLVANLGIALAQRGRKTLILDADLGLANIDVIFGVNPQFNLKHLVDGEKSLNEIVIEGPSALKIVPGGSGMPELADLSKEKQQQLMESFIELEKGADITLIDTGAGISNDIISFILAAREAIIITTPEPTAITDAYGMIKVLTQRDLDVDIKIVINMASSEKEGREIADRIVMATKQFLNKRIEVLGYIVSDVAVNMSVRKQNPFILEFPSSRASKCVKQIAATLDKTLEVSVTASGQNGFRGFLSRLFER